MLPNFSPVDQAVVVHERQRQLQPARRVPRSAPVRARIGQALIHAGVALGGERLEQSRRPGTHVQSPAS